MKICFLAASNSIHSYKWVNYFHEIGHDVTWISLSPTIFDIPEGIRFIEIQQHSMRLELISAVVKIRKLLAQIRPDLLHVHYVGLYGLLGLLSGVDQVVATPWGSDVIEGKQYFWKRLIIKGILKRANLITCDAFHMRDEVVALGVDEGKIELINFGIDSERFRKRTVNQEIRQQLDVNDAPTVISLRSFEPVYDVETLVRAVPIVLKSVPDTRFVLVGKGALEEDLRVLTQKLKVSHAVYFIGYLPNDQLPDILSSMDVYVSTSLSDAGIAASTAEAMACELPVVITDSGENGRWVDDEVNGYLVPVTQPQRLAERLIQLLENEPLRNSLGARGRETIHERNDYLIEMDKMDHLYQKMIQA